MDADVIIPMGALNWGTFYCCSVTIRTAAAHTNARIRIMANNMKEPMLSKLKELAIGLGCEWNYLEDMTLNLNVATIYNRAMRECKAKYLCVCGGDLIFYPDWLENLVRLWENEPSYYMLSPFSYTPEWKHLLTNPEEKILPLHPHASNSGLNVFKGELVRKNPPYDEQFNQWEVDSDLYWTMRQKGLKEGICLNSRVDHLGQAFFTLNDTRDIYGPKGLNQVEMSERLNEKWWQVAGWPRLKKD